MYASVDNQKNARHTALKYLVVSLFFALLGAVYGLYNREVYSYFMVYAFSIPLAGGALPFFLFSLVTSTRSVRYPGWIARMLYHAGITTLTMGCIMSGVLEILGTANILILVYWFIGAVIIAAAVLLYFTGKFVNVDLE